MFGFDEQTIRRQIKQHRNKYLEQWRKEREQQQAREQRMSQAANDPYGMDDIVPPPSLPDDIPHTPHTTSPTTSNTPSAAVSDVEAQEREIIRLIVNYGMCYLGNTEYPDGSVLPSTVLQHISNELLMDNMSFSNPLYRRTFEIAQQYIEPYYRDLARFEEHMNEEIRQFVASEMATRDDEPDGLDSAALILAAERKEKAVNAKACVMAKNERMDFSSGYLMKVLCSIDDDAVRQLACDFATDNLPQLSKIHSQFAVILEERDRLLSVVTERIFNWKNALLIQQINETKSQIAHADSSELPKLMEHLQYLYSLRHQLAAVIGDRVVNPD